MSEEDYEDYGMFLLFFSGHGCNGKIYGCGEDKSMCGTVDLNTIFGYFQPHEAHESLKTKPKVFLLDCCRGKLSDDGSKGFHFEDNYMPPTHADFLYAYASAPLFQAYVGCKEKTDDLSVWTHFLNLANDIKRGEHHLADLLTFVQKDVLDYVPDDKKQSSNHVNYLRGFLDI
eukprot:TRINITY_DN1460_c0_g1_i2.p1 TRINITY_DN1460_c0_g1~~TRINITY_DN1460_c0_g1_i2.p1  ORF type:complete len:173 (+),score=27.48 TRINITY_DN1460_c0_g1_i2:81-599(+)